MASVALQPAPDAVEDRHRLHTRSAVAAKARLGGVGADHGDGLQRHGIHRQHRRLVLQQHQPRTRRLAGQRSMGRLTVQSRRVVLIHVRLLEQPERKLHAEDTRNRRVHDRRLDQSAAKRIEMQPGYEMVGIKAGVIRQERAIREIRSQSDLGQSLTDVEFRIVMHVIDKAS